MESDLFMSPESTHAPEVRSPNVPAALEGETMGPSYGSVQAAGSGGGMVNGVSGSVGVGLGALPSREESRSGLVLGPSGTSGICAQGTGMHTGGERALGDETVHALLFCQQSNVPCGD